MTIKQKLFNVKPLKSFSSIVLSYIDKASQTAEQEQFTLIWNV